MADGLQRIAAANGALAASFQRSTLITYVVTIGLAVFLFAYFNYFRVQYSDMLSPDGLGDFFRHSLDEPGFYYLLSQIVLGLFVTTAALI